MLLECGEDGHSALQECRRVNVHIALQHGHCAHHILLLIARHAWNARVAQLLKHGKNMRDRNHSKSIRKGKDGALRRLPSCSEPSQIDPGRAHFFQLKSSRPSQLTPHLIRGADRAFRETVKDAVRTYEHFDVRADVVVHIDGYHDNGARPTTMRACMNNHVAYAAENVISKR